MSAEIHVRVITFGSAVAALGFEERELALPADSTLADLVLRLEADFPRLVEARGRIRYAVNLAYAGPSTTLGDGDEIALIPPVSGGAPTGPIRVARIVREAIVPADLIAAAECPASGALATFLGVVRAELNPAGQPLIALEYSGHETLAIAEMERLLAAHAADPTIQAALIVHRIGRLEIGAASVAIVVSSAHRAAAFDVCRRLIEELKVSVPIFKREIWKDGSGSWVNPL